ncbi:hypothetical protein ACH5RR_010882 [Cinchona calisaya]|uniref:Uncharacterized protein n=1 Tax=Cinchona calisaya TaxID=153742 RepID=A0ABD3AK64_9GENT
MEKDGAVVGGVDYWLRWQVPVCALVFLVPTLVSLILIRKRRRASSGHLLHHHHLWIPCWRNLHPRWLLYYRALACLTMTFLLYQIVQSFGFLVFFFYTQWTFALVVVYFALATIISARGCSIYSTTTTFAQSQSEQHKDRFSKNNSEEEETKDDQSKGKQGKGFIMYQSQVPIDQQAGFWGNLMLSIYQTCAGAVMLTDIVFWCLLLPFMSGEHFQLTLLIAYMHSVNAVFLILDSALNSLEFSWFGIVYFILWSSSYVVFQWALHVCCFTWWPYPFLDLSNPWAPMWYLALALVHIPCYGLYVLLVKGKNSIFSKIVPHAYLRISVEKKQN